MPRGGDDPNTFSSERNRMLFSSMLNWKTNGWNPFDEEAYRSKKFWKSHEEFEKLSYPAFVENVDRLAGLARGQMTISKQREAEQAAKVAQDKRRTRIRNNKRKSIDERCVEDDILLRMTSLSLNESKRAQKATPSTIVVTYPKKDKVLVIVPLKGDVDGLGSKTADEFDFDSSRTMIVHWSRLPKDWIHSKRMVGSKQTHAAQDADCMLIVDLLDRYSEVSIPKNTHPFVWHGIHDTL
eukprot:scaffold22461_cov93-Cylindrotheca_fusiformis.AAC.3